MYYMQGKGRWSSPYDARFMVLITLDKTIGIKVKKCKKTKWSQSRPSFKKMEITTVASSDRATAISFTLVSGDGKKRERSLKIFSQRVLLKLTYSKLSIFYKRLKLHILRSKALFAFPLTVTFNWYLETEYRQSSVRLSGPVFILCVLTLSQNYRYTISVTFHSKVTILAKR